VDDPHPRASQAGVLTSYTDLHGDLVSADDQALAAVLDALDRGLQRLPEGRFGPQGLLRSVPATAWRPSTPRRDWGIFLPHHALHTQHTRGLGDLTALAELGRWAAEHGASLLGTLPLLPTFLHRDGPYEPSPYAPVSRRFWGEHLIDPTATREWEHCPQAQGILDQARADGTLQALREGEHVDPAGAWELQWRLLSALAQVAWSGERGQALESHLAGLVRHGGASGEQLHTYARFRAATAAHGPWPTWPGVSERFEGHTPSRPLAWNDEHAFPPVDPDQVRVWLYAQVEAERQVARLRTQLEAAGIDLYLDLPIGTHPDGFDTFYGTGCCPLHVDGVSAGAPPDPMFPSGQDWGFPPVHPSISQATDHQDLRWALGTHATAAHRLRIDHILGFYRMFWVPRGLGATRGVYVRYPAADWWKVLIQTSHRTRCQMIGENLGMVPEQLTRAMMLHEIDGMHVGQFALRPDASDPLEDPEPGALTCLNTHDTPTFAGWWTGEDLTTQESLGWLQGDRAVHQRAHRRWQVDQLRPLARQGPLAHTKAPEALRVAAALYQRLAHSRAGTVLVNLEDLWAEERPHNVPGTWRERPNWLRRSARSLESLAHDPHIESVLAALRHERPPQDAP